jgi:pimeloyl-ACP methyl ester carboxylesterase
VCPDIVGRGDSDWLLDANLYTYPQYLADMTALLARLDVEAVDWLGTSMGGLIGMMLAAQPQTPVRRLVLNDIGPFIPQAALERLAGYVGLRTTFATSELAEAYFREVHGSFGPLTNQQWRELTDHSVARSPDGTYALRYDPKIGEALRSQPPADVDLWPVWEQIHCPVLVLRGADSDMLPTATAGEMRERGPGTEVVEVPGVGHAPALVSEAQIQIVSHWLKHGSVDRGRNETDR